MKKMKYTIDLPNDGTVWIIQGDREKAVCLNGFIGIDGTVQLNSDSVPLIPYCDEYCVGDEVTYENNYGYVLVPDYNGNNCIILSDEYSCPQIVPKSDWKRTGGNNKEIARFVKLSAEALDKKQL
jgi:hypothetical protein